MKLIFSANMFLGRVEIYPIFAVISALVNRKYQGRA
jgi:Trk-type K+ transport system membrane component